MTSTTPAKKPTVLCILDGWGQRENTTGNAVAQADTPTFDRVMATCPHATLITHGPDVGLPRGQMGNSEVGHTNIGAGRVVAMDLGQIDLAVEDGSFATNPALQEFIAKVQAAKGTAHLIGVVSDGGVHGHITHLQAAVKALTSAGVPVAIHAITDGRDVPPSSARGFMATLADSLPAGAQIATVIGRYWAMDRDTRWDRVQRAYDAMVSGKGEAAPDAAAAIDQAYAAGQTDEFIAPTAIAGYSGVQPGDGLFCLNFRADRAREILSALAAPGFEGFETAHRPDWSAALGMVEYSDAHNAFMATAYPKRKLVNTLGAWVAAKGLRQFRVAETEKYPHVTFFLNGGKEAPEKGEDRAMPKSPNVATYDLQPEMSAPEVTDKLVEAIGAGYDLIVCNYANPDMVGHTGDLGAAIAACQAVDRCLARVLDALDAAGGAMLLTADHGNCEMMTDPETGQPHTAHTLNPVPVALIGGPDGTGLAAGRLADVAPTLLDLMGLQQPSEMTGKSLLRR
ncbi:2,3-bisphosphoglycerate-independent phosphoglycerate mutase [Roseicitreum antarcticum]|uniref:2,3-bisphosphoglycerate-independent phosphoglycerate mutase n=1 Tax=Roseicitreum antarcticum TaxID=564137 RepID=A0A1H2RLB7_9RHOB|nr:2,3-bisphosphoglycerate-independent phosphoglycerate mutase [Roseicitreum antarcticum]SDW20283.1 phosphoglycerate mutase [Roseicitreum antarcticum]